MQHTFNFLIWEILAFKICSLRPIPLNLLSLTWWFVYSHLLQYYFQHSLWSMKNLHSILTETEQKCYNWFPFEEVLLKNNEIDLPTVENCWCMLRFSSFQLFYIPYFENAPKTYNLTSKKMSEDTLLMISVINFIITVCRWRCHLSDVMYSKMTIIQNVRDRSLKGICLL